MTIDSHDIATPQLDPASTEPKTFVVRRNLLTKTLLRELTSSEEDEHPVFKYPSIHLLPVKLGRIAVKKFGYSEAFDKVSEIIGDFPKCIPFKVESVSLFGLTRGNKNIPRTEHIISLHADSEIHEIVDKERTKVYTALGFRPPQPFRGLVIAAFDTPEQGASFEQVLHGHFQNDYARSLQLGAPHIYPISSRT
jgi:hypothetical protein